MLIKHDIPEYKIFDETSILSDEWWGRERQVGDNIIS